MMYDPTQRSLLRQLSILALSVAALAACSETPAAPAVTTRASGDLLNTASCGASFRMVSSEQDDLMSQDGVPNTVDTVDVCEQWTGNDYAYQATAVGSSDNVPGFVDSVQTVTYQNGSVTGYTESVNAAAPPSPVGSTSFDMLFADDPTRQASYDYPYYGISSPDPSTCVQAPCPVVSLNTTARLTNGSINSSNITGSSSTPAPRASGNVVPQFGKHGLTRRGIRALVNDAEEIAPSSEGYRRFRSVHGAETIVRSVDPKTQLLVAEESYGPSDTMYTRHAWAQTVGGYVRDYSDFETVETVNRKKLRSHTRIAFQKVRVTDPAFPALSTPVPIP